MIILLAIVVVAVSVPLASVVLVSLASKREDSAQSLSGRPRGPLEAAARRMVGFHGDATGLNGTGLNATGYLADQPDVPHLVG